MSGVRFPYVAAFGTGTQKVEQMIGMEFPNARVLRLDRDSTARKDSMEEILEKFRKHEDGYPCGNPDDCQRP